MLTWIVLHLRCTMTPASLRLACLIIDGSKVIDWSGTHRSAHGLNGLPFPCVRLSRWGTSWRWRLRCESLHHSSLELLSPLEHVLIQQLTELLVLLLHIFDQIFQSSLLLHHLQPLSILITCLSLVLVHLNVLLIEQVHQLLIFAGDLLKILSYSCLFFLNLLYLLIKVTLQVSQRYL